MKMTTNQSFWRRPSNRSASARWNISTNGFKENLYDPTDCPVQEPLTVFHSSAGCSSKLCGFHCEGCRLRWRYDQLHHRPILGRIPVYFWPIQHQSFRVHSLSGKLHHLLSVTCRKMHGSSGSTCPTVGKWCSANLWTMKAELAYRSSCGHRWKFSCKQLQEEPNVTNFTTWRSYSDHLTSL